MLLSNGVIGKLCCGDVQTLRHSPTIHRHGYLLQRLFQEVTQTNHFNLNEFQLSLVDDIVEQVFVY
jgi:hypothetical protein